MSKRKRHDKHGIYIPELQCNVAHMTYEFRSGFGELTLYEGNCPDMGGAIAFFMRIDPNVTEIRTSVVGGSGQFGYSTDITYCRYGRHWKAHLSEDDEA